MENRFLKIPQKDLLGSHTLLLRLCLIESLFLGEIGWLWWILCCATQDCPLQERKTYFSICWECPGRQSSVVSHVEDSPGWLHHTRSWPLPRASHTQWLITPGSTEAQPPCHNLGQLQAPSLQNSLASWSRFPWRLYCTPVSPCLILLPHLAQVLIPRVFPSQPPDIVSASGCTSPGEYPTMLVFPGGVNGSSWDTLYKRPWHPPSKRDRRAPPP